jgi:hypothetical protein
MLLALAVLSAGALALPARVRAQEIDFGKIDRFESVGTSKLRVGSPPKVVIDDDEPHTVVLTIWDADAQTKVDWKSLDGKAQTTVLPGKGVQTFQTLGVFKLEAQGDPNHSVEYGYLLLRNKDH